MKYVTGRGRPTAALLLLVSTAAACPRPSPANDPTAPAANTTKPQDGAAEPGSPDARKERTLVDCVVAIAKHARLAPLAPAAAARLCGGAASASEVATSWVVGTPFPALEVVANDSGGPERPAGEYEMTIRAEGRLRLSDVAAQIGSYRTVFESKTASVSFAGPPGSGAVFADLLSPIVSPAATVIRVVARAPAARPAP